MTEWKTIAEFPNYEVSDDGRVRSIGGIRQFGPNQRYVEGRILKLRRHSSGYLYVSFWNGEKSVNRYVHRLVAKAFIPNPDCLPEVNHQHPDGDKTRNNKGNLEWTSRLGNIAHSKDVLIDRAPIGARHGMSKLTEQNALEIAQSTLSNAELMAKYGVSEMTIQGIRTGKRWRHLQFQRRHNAQKRGTDIGLAKLDEDKVREIRASTDSHAALGRRFGVSGVAIRQVRNGRTWAHVI